VDTGDRDIQSLEVRCGSLSSSCSWKGELRNLEKHTSLCLQPCKYASLGCTAKMLPEKLVQHEETCITERLVFAMVRIEALEKKLAKTSLAAAPPVNPVGTFAPATFQFKGHWGDASASFYSHPNGYKFMLTINYEVSSVSIAVKIFLMRGENDDNLVWPLRGVVNFVLLNQEENSGHKYGSAKFMERKMTVRNQRVPIGREKNNEGWGDNLLMDNLHFIDNGCLVVKVTEVVVESVGKSWLNDGLVVVNT